MGIEYDLVSDATREGYELGKGPWGDDEFIDALRSLDPIQRVTSYLVTSGAGMGWGRFDLVYANIVAQEITAFAAAHPDWRVINDSQSDIWVATEEDAAEDIAIHGAEDHNLPIYRQVGTRYRKEK